MNWWTLAIYGAAAAIALHGLLSLMTAHRAAALRRFFNEELQQRAEAAAASRAAEPDATKPSPNIKAA